MVVFNKALDGIICHERSVAGEAIAATDIGAVQIILSIWGYSRRKSGSSNLNVGSRGQSGRTGNMAGESVVSQEQSLALMLAEHLNAQVRAQVVIGLL